MSRLAHVDELLAVLSRYVRIRERLAVTKFRTPDGVVENAAFQCLFMLAERPMRSGELAECLFADPSTVSRHVANLVRLGYVRREADARDGRATILVLTGTGREQVRTLRDHRMRAVDTMLSDFSDTDLTTLTGLMSRVVTAAEEMAIEVGNHIDGADDAVSVPTAAPAHPDREHEEASR